MLYVIAVSHTSQNSTGNHFVIQAILHTNCQLVQLLNSSPRHFLKKDAWHHRYQNKLGVSVLSISHLVYLNIKQIRQKNHNQCKLVQWTWELPSLLNYFLLNYNISWNVAWQALVTESSSWWWKTLKHWKKCLHKSKISRNFSTLKCKCLMWYSRLYPK